MIQGMYREWNQFDRQNRLTYFLQDINKRIERGFIDPSYTNICHGILGRISTGRVNPSGVIGWLCSHPINELLEFLQELRAHCQTMLEVVYYLHELDPHLGERIRQGSGSNL